MKLIYYELREQVVCPTKDYCEGEPCSCFNKWRDWYDTKVIKMEYKKPWWSTFRPFYFERQLSEQFNNWEPPTIDGWELDRKEFSDFWDDPVPKAIYEKLNPDRRFWCGLNSSN